MRRAYRDTFLKMLKSPPQRGRWSGMLLKVLLAHIRPGLIRPFTSPILATLKITHRCNLNCIFCESKRINSPEQDPQWMESFVHEISRAGVLGLGITGGEPLLAESLETVIALASREGLITHLNTNGTLLSLERAMGLLETGLSSVNVSLDGTDASTHDLLRGEGCFARTMEGIEALVGARERVQAETRLLLTMTLGEYNAHQTLSLIDLAQGLGVDGCTYLPVSVFSSSERHRKCQAAADAARRLLTQAEHPMVDNSKGYLKGLVRFFEGTSMPGRCSAPHTSILVSPERKLYPCVPLAVRGNDGVEYHPGELLNLFRTGTMKTMVDEYLCSDCWWNCHRELDLALGII